jgi:hypothetical protein
VSAADGGSYVAVSIGTPQSTRSAPDGNHRSASSKPSSDFAPTNVVVSRVQPVPAADHPHTRSQSGISQPKIITRGRIRYDRVQFANYCSTGEPTALDEAFADPKWKSAMNEEYMAKNNRTWHLVPASDGRNVIDCKWVYKIKRRADVSINRYKARLVATGFK